MNTILYSEAPLEMYSSKGTIARKLGKAHNKVINELRRYRKKASNTCVKIDSLIL